MQVAFDTDTKDETCIISFSTFWKVPNLYQIRMNINDSFTISLKRAGVGGLLEDHNGKWLFGSYDCCPCLIRTKLSSNFVLRDQTYFSNRISDRSGILQGDSRHMKLYCSKGNSSNQNKFSWLNSYIRSFGKNTT